jgi:hypothetical protein
METGTPVIHPSSCPPGEKKEEEEEEEICEGGSVTFDVCSQDIYIFLFFALKLIVVSGERDVAWGWESSREE